MFYFFIVLYGLSLSEAYNIKVSGQVELGKQLSKLFREAYYGVGGSLDKPSDTDRDRLSFNFDTVDPYGAGIKGKSSSTYKKNEPDNSQESSHVSVLDEMVQNEQRNLHLYGNHRLEKDKAPLNNINI